MISMTIVMTVVLLTVWWYMTGGCRIDHGECRRLGTRSVERYLNVLDMVSVTDSSCDCILVYLIALAYINDCCNFYTFGSSIVSLILFTSSINYGAVEAFAFTCSRLC